MIRLKVSKGLWVVNFGLIRHTQQRFFQLSLMGGNVVASSTAGCSTSPLLSLHSSLTRLVGSSSVVESLLLWHLRYKQWHTYDHPLQVCLMFSKSIDFSNFYFTYLCLFVFLLWSNYLFVKNKYYFTYILVYYVALILISHLWCSGLIIRFRYWKITSNVLLSQCSGC